MVKVSVIVPSKGLGYLELLFKALRDQTIRPDEVIIIIKDYEAAKMEKILQRYSLNLIIIEQKEGTVTRAYSIGKKTASGDIILFTDNDAIPHGKWVENYVKLHFVYPHIPCIASRDIYFDIINNRTLQTSHEKVQIRLRRWFIQSWLSQPHPLLAKYRFGVYLTKNFEMKIGPYIPYRTCYSLSFKGVNMSFKRDFASDLLLPEDPKVVRGIGFEQYLALQLLLRGYDSIFVPSNPVYHIFHESLSRSKDIKPILEELEAMRTHFHKLLSGDEAE